MPGRAPDRGRGHTHQLKMLHSLRQEQGQRMARSAEMAVQEMGETAKLPARIEFWRSADKRATTQTQHHRGGSHGD